MSDTAQAEAAPVAEAPAVLPGTENTDDAEIAAALAAVEAEGEPAPDAKKEPEAKAKDDDKPKEGEPKKEEGPAAKGWAAVRRVEQKLAKERKEFATQQQQLNSRMSQIEEQAKRLAERESKLDSDPVSYLKEKGMTFDDLANRHLKDGKASPEEMARREALESRETIKQLMEEVKEIKEAEKQREIKTFVTVYKNDIKTALAADDLDLLRAWPDAEAEVLDIANKWLEKHGKVLTPRDAALRLQESLKVQLTGLSSHQAIRNFLASGGSTETKQAVGGLSKAPRTSNSSATLTNNLAATPATAPDDWDSLNEEDQIQAALRLVQDA